MVDLLSALFKLVDAGTSAVASQVLSLRLKPNIRPVNMFLEREKNSTDVLHINHRYFHLRMNTPALRYH